jgi:hypothetical protein
MLGCDQRQVNRGWLHAATRNPAEFCFTPRLISGSVERGRRGRRDAFRRWWKGPRKYRRRYRRRTAGKSEGNLQCGLGRPDDFTIAPGLTVNRDFTAGSNCIQERLAIASKRYTKYCYAGKQWDAFPIGRGHLVDSSFVSNVYNAKQVLPGIAGRIEIHSRVGLSNRKDRPDLKGLDEFAAFGVYCRQ